jgi:hypothetical protein
MHRRRFDADRVRSDGGVLKTHRTRTDNRGKSRQRVTHLEANLASPCFFGAYYRLWVKPGYHPTMQPGAAMSRRATPPS